MLLKVKTYVRSNLPLRSIHYHNSSPDPEIGCSAFGSRHLARVISRALTELLVTALGRSNIATVVLPS